MAEQKIPLLNRELSWLEFNRRVLAEAEEPSVPLLERVKFLAIAATNLDEFLMVRAGALRQLIATGSRERSPDGLTPKQQLKAIRDRVKKFQREMDRIYEELLPQLREGGPRIESGRVLTKKQLAALGEEFEARIGPILTPLAVDPGHPFPFLPSGSLSVAVILDSGTGDTHTAFITVPRVQPRFVAIPGTMRRYLPVEEVIRLHVDRFFPGLTVREVVPFRILRNSDMLLREDEVEDLLKSVELELRRRERKEVVWVEVSGEATPILELLQRELHIARDDIYVTGALTKLGDLMEVYNHPAPVTMKDEPFNPRIPAELATSDDIFSIIRAGDVLLHRPYDSYTAVVEFIQSAVEDPAVLAIKQTLYRTEPGSVVVEALAQAALRGKQVTAVVEVQARFDEERNIAWARRLEEAGVQVVHGLVGIKTHCKLCLVIRREAGGLRRYVHLSTGNYNARTARLYTDLDLLTADEGFGNDAAQLMNLLTGFSAGTATEMFESHAATGSPGWRWQRFVVAPMEYHAWTLRMIAREEQNARDKKPAAIVAKLNSLVEPTVIEALYRAADAGVKIDLIIRGICALVPRPNIRVVSIVDRFLEHTRFLLFRNAGAVEVYVASGDWMPRNFFRRIELVWPILSPALRDRIEHQILGTCMADDLKAWKLNADGTYRRRRPSARPIRSQQRFIETARAEAVRIGPYDEAVRRPGVARRKTRRKKS